MAAPTLKVSVGADLSAFEEGMKTLNALSRQAAKTTLEQFLAVNAELAKSSQTIMRTGDKQLSDVLSRSDMSSRAKDKSAGKDSKTDKAKAEEDGKGKDDKEVKRPLLDFANEAKAVDKALENAALNGIKKFESGVIGLVMGTKTLKQAFSDMAKSIAEDFLRIAIRQVTGPLAGALGGLFGGGNVDASSFIGPVLPGNANGTDNWRGGLTWVGERGPELVNVPRGAQIVPNEILRNGSGGVSAPVRISIDARGADESGIVRLQAQLAKLEANLPARIVSTVREANKTRQLS